MFSHICVGSNNLQASKKFYDAIFTVLQGESLPVGERKRLMYIKNGSRFIITEPIDGHPATPANGGTIGFAVNSPEEARAWHKAGIENGGTSAENLPGVRNVMKTKIFLAYLRDPDGNKLCAYYPIQTS